MFSTRTKFKYVLIESYVPEHTGGRNTVSSALNVTTDNVKNIQKVENL